MCTAAAKNNRTWNCLWLLVAKQPLFLFLLLSVFAVLFDSFVTLEIFLKPHCRPYCATHILNLNITFMSPCPQVHEVQAPVQVKKNKKKAKTDVKPVQKVSTADGKEPDDGESQPCHGEFHKDFSFSKWLLQFHAPHVFQHLKPTCLSRPLWFGPTVSCCSLVFKQLAEFHPTANRLKFLFIIVLHITSILTIWCCFLFIATRCVGDQSQQPREEAAAQEGQGPRGLWGPRRGGDSKAQHGGTCDQYQEEQRKQWYI